MSRFYDFLRDDLKHPDQCTPTHFALRTALQVVEPDSDQLTRQILPVLQKYLPEFSGTFLDVGCYGGWVYPYVRDRVEYHGIDKWEDAVTAGTKLFGNRFTHCDVMDYDVPHDIVWCSQIVETDYTRLWAKLKSLTRRMAILASPGVNVSEVCDSSDRFSIAIYRVR